MSDKNATEVVLADEEGIARATRILEAGGLVAVPTETVYGLAARADSPEAVAKIFAAKGRPDFNPLIVHVRDTEQAARYARWSDHADLAVTNYWPGPLTLVLPKRNDAALAPAVTAGLDTVALRAPAHPVMRALLNRIEFPLAAPSANRSGFISPTSAQHVMASLDGRIDLVLDGGASDQGVESSILAIRENGSWEELRAGPVDLDALHRHYFDVGLDDQATVAEGSVIEAPGQLVSHYSPGKPLRLNAREAFPGEFFIGFGGGGSDFDLSPDAHVAEAASRLYDALHQAAISDHARIAVAPIPNEGIGRAINDRLRRAAAPLD
ncbi:L-threonylcarbamoyladenylate synthase [Erythrobacter sp. YT30]|uniref:L-threonylcarbamoyladenylate synthase n=1 Tax=Erythrobacter sp. YT30 TaxID=1735012 RepID=UPI00076C906D|nr:L-threonylcarbamoyladenylate synthase [Erythrobacter sp. YT30]KWV91400.1 translation factor Sua5 [Erythrobacter sp. YT30]